MFYSRSKAKAEFVEQLGSKKKAAPSKPKKVKRAAKRGSRKAKRI